MTLGYLYLGLCSACVIALFMSVFKNMGYIIDFIKHISVFKSKKSIVDSCNKQLKNKNLLKIDEICNNIKPDRLDAFKVSTSKEDIGIDTEFTNLTNKYDARLSELKCSIKAIKDSYLRELDLCDYYNIKGMKVKLLEAEKGMQDVIDGLNVSVELENLIITIEKELSASDLKILRLHIESCIETLKAIKSFAYNTIKSDYKLKLEELTLLDYDILNYNEYLSHKFIKLDSVVLIDKIKKMLKDLKFDVGSIDSNILKVHSDISGINYLIYVSVDNLNKGVLTMDTIDTEELSKIESIAELHLKDNYRVTLLTNRNFSQEAFNHIINTHKIECLTINSLLELPILTKSDIASTRKGLMHELFIRKETLKNI